MNWLTNVVRPKIRNILRRETPENLWIKCPDTGQLVFYKDVESNQFVIPGSNYHMRMGAVARLKSIFDNETWYDIALPEVTADPLKFRDERKYADRIKDARAKTGLNDAIKVGYGKLEGAAVVVAVQDFDFMGGSLGMAAGEAIVRGLELAVEKKIALHRVRRLRRRADAGRHPVADAIAAHHCRRADAARSQTALYRGADQSDHRRRHRVLRHARRRADRRARRIDRLCRRARDRTDHPREIAGRFSARRISQGPRHDRHGGASPRSAADLGAAVPAADEVAGDRGRAKPAPEPIVRAGSARIRSRTRRRQRRTRERAGGQTDAAARRPDRAAIGAASESASISTLERMHRLLQRLGHPERKLPPVIHVAGTNGKGSTIAYLRAILEAAGLRVHVFTSPYLVRINESYRLGKAGGGVLVDDDELRAVLEHCERVNDGRADHHFRDRNRGGVLPVRAASGRCGAAGSRPRRTA